MKKILFLNTVARGGGAAYIAESLFNKCNDNLDFDARFAYGRSPVVKGKRYFYFGNKLEVFIHIFLVRFLGLEGYGSYFATRKLIKYIKQEKFDLVHVHNLHGYYLNFFTLIKFLEGLKIKVVWTLQDEWLFTWLPAYSTGCNHCKTLKGKCTNVYSYPKNYFPLFSHWLLRKKQNFFSKADFITLVSPAQWLLEEEKHSLFNNLRSIYIPNSTDINIFHPQENKELLKNRFGIPLNKKIIAFSANNLRQASKGIRFIIEVAHLLQEKDYYFVGFGRGELEIPNNVHLFGYVNQKRSAEILSLADVYIFTSLVEVMPLVVLQALAVGLPIIAFDILPLREIISSKIGKLIGYGKTEELAQELDDILSNDIKLKELSNNAQQMGNNFSQGRMLNSYLELYNSI